ncbi:MAG TPA: hypothetical protein VF532_21945 [Candidatus Angelobacter sp.]
MPESLAISPEPPANKGLDYSYLRDEGIALLQQLAGKIWTDFNEHDPGVTVLEQLCYALTELSYRAELPLQDLLAERDTGNINTRKQAMFIPRRILPCNPVTENDYRKLIVDRVPEVANAWCVPWRARESPDFVNGLYDLWLYAPGADACSPELSPTAIRERVRHVYCRHRDLCEDLHSIQLLEQVRTLVYADVTLAGIQRPEAVLAQLFFNIGNFLAPEVRRHSLKDFLQQGKSTSEIFNGPLLRNGFIDDAQLQPKAAAIPVQDIVRVITRTQGVTTARNVEVRVGKDEVRYAGNDSIPVPQQQILRLDTRPLGKHFAIRLFHNGLECVPDPNVVERELNQLWTNYRRILLLLPQYEEFFAVPQGRYRHLERYYSIQNQFPVVYGIGAFGLPSEATQARRAMARQFKGYLLVFEQLLADFFAQLARAKDLYSTENLCQTYFYQSLAMDVPDVGPLLNLDYVPGLKRIVRDADPFIERRNRFLDFLLALYAEELKASSTRDAATCGQAQAGDAASLLPAKLALLRHLVASTRDRGRGVDYLAPASPANIAGMEIKTRIQLGMEPVGHRPLIDVLEEYGLSLADSDAVSSLGRPLSRHTDHIEENFSPISWDQPESEPTLAAKPGSFLHPQTVTPELFRAAGKAAEFRTGALPGDTTTVLVCKSPADIAWRLLGKYENAAAALAAASDFSRVSQMVDRAAQQLYIVEHTLLRFARSGNPEREPSEPRRGGFTSLEEGRGYGAVSSQERLPESTEPLPGKFEYSFTITAVVSASPSLGDDTGYRKLVRDVVRENTPAHIVVNYCFLRPAQMCRFEWLYWNWRSALRSGDRHEIRRCSELLQAFLHGHQEPPWDAGMK